MSGTCKACNGRGVRHIFGGCWERCWQCNGTGTAAAPRLADEISDWLAGQLQIDAALETLAQHRPEESITAMVERRLLYPQPDPPARVASRSARMPKHLAWAMDGASYRAALRAGALQADPDDDPDQQEET